MKFLITSGRKKGLSFTVTDSEFKIGRRKDNDVMLDDESISGYHAKIVNEDGRIFVLDCDSINGIEVNGRATKKATLEKGDVVTIGQTQITAMDDDDASETKKGKTNARLPSKPASSSKKKSSPLKTALALLLVLAVAGMAFYVFNLRKPRSPSTGSSLNTAEANKGMFRLTYEKIQASKENIFRYEMKIENNILFVSVDDLKQSRTLRSNKEILPKQAADIRDAIKDQQILTLPPKTEGKSLDVWDSYTLSVIMGNEVHTVQVLNRVLPDNLKAICSMLESFGEHELTMVASSMSLEELKKRAQDSCQRARKLYDERSVNAENLYNAIKAYTETINYLDSVEPKPSIYADAVHGKQVASDELENQLNDHQFRSTRAIQLKEWRTARDELATILQKIPDPDDKRNQDARIRLLDVEKRLQPK